ncbi:mitochondrial 54S ribosomal protein uL3m [Apiospora aurea]|uniref:Large ribosomal subunit protein uL3m n=1 Tax=Apiospora aurea TaxID=335848 RepID=A0ABR1Q8S8_9PEZI
MVNLARQRLLVGNSNNSPPTTTTHTNPPANNGTTTASRLGGPPVVALDLDHRPHDPHPPHRTPRPAAADGQARRQVRLVDAALARAARALQPGLVRPARAHGGPRGGAEAQGGDDPLRTGVLAVKKGVSAMFVGGLRTPCTILQMEQVEVVAAKTRAKNGYWAVQLGLGHKNAGNVTAPLLGYYEAKGVAPKRHLAEFKVRTEEGLLPVGVQLQPDWFKLGQFVDARSNSRGMGFAGGMKRHNFGGQGASHGNSKNHRTIGTTGPSQGGGSRVHPGKKMPGRMGNERVTVQNLRVLKVDNEMGIVVISGHVAGPKGCVARRILMERNPEAETKLEQARLRHLELKEARKEGTIGEAMLASTAAATTAAATEIATA